MHHGKDFINRIWYKFFLCKELEIYIIGDFKISASLIAQLVKNPPPMQEIPAWFLGREDLLEKG